MRPKRQVYLLDPQKLSPETIAVTFAKTSRSPESFRDIAAELTDEKSAQFHEKWVVGYGHSSVAEHATLHIAVENVSRLAVEMLEASRLASYTEKSTRYQNWDLDSFFIPAEITQPEHQQLYIDTCRMLFHAYAESLDVLRVFAQTEMPREEGESDRAYDRRLRSEFVDVSRFLLPAASLANVGVTINARVLEHALCKMLSHPLAEVRDLGEEIKLIAQEEVPTLVKYAHPLPYLNRTAEIFNALLSSVRPRHGENWCQLIDYDQDAEDKVLTAALYRYSGVSYSQAADYLAQLRLHEKLELAQVILGDCTEHTVPLRELEHASFTFDLVLDQGAYYELKRHRMMTQTPQELTTLLGYATPRWMEASGFGERYHRAMQAADEAFQTLAAVHPAAAAYVVPNAYNRRVLLTLNMRTADHLLSLRSARNAHFSIRRVAQRMTEEIRQVCPIFGPMLRCYPQENSLEIEQQYFSSTHS
ncbi:MAG: FAD-dependent thymidylate synthase [Anaerolineaceae bacterium]|nr:FAD-dependent thymidylate synthase [Anaerolineaceae bacterium]